MNNDARRIDLSVKFRKMADSLKEEAVSTGDVTISGAGNIIALLSTLILFDEDMKTFSTYGEMFTAKRILDTMLNGEPDNISLEISEHIRKSTEAFESKLGLKKPRKSRRKRGDDLSPEA